MKDVVADMRTGQRFEALNPQRVLRNPLFFVPWGAFPMVGAFLVWFTREDLERTAFYWVFFAAFEFVWLWALRRMLEGVVDPVRNFIEVREDGLTVKLFGILADTLFRYDRIESVEPVAHGHGLRDSIFYFARLPRSQHVLITLKSPSWRLFGVALGGFRPRALPVQIEDQERFLTTVKDRLSDARA